MFEQFIFENRNFKNRHFDGDVVRHIFVHFSNLSPIPFPVHVNGFHQLSQFIYIDLQLNNLKKYFYIQCCTSAMIFLADNIAEFIK